MIPKQKYNGQKKLYTRVLITPFQNSKLLAAFSHDTKKQPTDYIQLIWLNIASLAIYSQPDWLDIADLAKYSQFCYIQPVIFIQSCDSTIFYTGIYPSQAMYILISVKNLFAPFMFFFKSHSLISKVLVQNLKVKFDYILTQPYLGMFSI